MTLREKRVRDLAPGELARTKRLYESAFPDAERIPWNELLRLADVQKGFVARNTGTVEAYYRESGASVSGSKLKALSWTWDIYRRELGLPLGASVGHFIRYGVKGLLKKIK